MWDEIMDMPGEIFDMDIDDRDQMPPDMQEDIEHEDPLTWEETIEQMSNDPEFIAEVEKQNALWDEAAAAALEMTVDELHKWLAIDKTQPIAIIQNERVCNAS